MCLKHGKLALSLRLEAVLDRNVRGRIRHIRFVPHIVDPRAVNLTQLSVSIASLASIAAATSNAPRPPALQSQNAGHSWRACKRFRNF
jgi:hypothetical protein